MAFVADLMKCGEHARIRRERQKKSPSEEYFVSAPPDLGSYECVAAVKALTGAQETARWRRGKRVKGNKNAILPGTAIATFRKISGVIKFKGHSAILVRVHDVGIEVYD